MKKFRKNNKGFTLIELIVVVAILVALMLMLVPRLTGFTDDDKKTANEANARAIYIAIAASETAESTGMYKTDEKTVKLCSDTANVYAKFWEDGDIAKGTAANACEATIVNNHVTEVTYGGAKDSKTAGTYPLDDNSTPTTGD